MSLVRESFHQRELDQLTGGRTEQGHEVETTAEIIVDDRNPRDDTVVRIDIDNKTIGYPALGDAREYRTWPRNQHYPDDVILECPALISGGWD